MPPPSARTPGPNILWIVSDQHSPHVAGFTGDTDADTPNLDRLAAQSVRFSRASCNAPLCVPSRISFLTGRYPVSCGAFANRSELPADAEKFPTVAELVGQAGYATALIGKMHLKGPRSMGGFAERPYGDLVVGSYAGHQPDPPETADGRWSNHAEGRFPFAGESAIPEALHIDPTVTRASLAWLAEHTDRHPETPWFLCASFPRPHFPLTAPGRFLRAALARRPTLPVLPDGYPESLHPHDRFIVEDFGLTRFDRARQAHSLACYHACVSWVDACIGELLDGLARLGADEETWIVYSSDHGELAGEHGLWWKRSPYEASTGVPLLVRPPGGVGSGGSNGSDESTASGGSTGAGGVGVATGVGRSTDQGAAATTDRPVELVDLLPTFCELAGIAAPDSCDGTSLFAEQGGDLGALAERLARLLDDRGRGVGERVVRSELIGGAEHVRHRMACDGRFKYVEYPRFPPRLFDLGEDPGENRDLVPEGVEPPPDLVEAARLGRSWSDIDRASQAESARPAAPGPGAAQFRLADGRLVDPDRVLYDR